MNLAEVVHELSLTVETGAGRLDTEVTGAYVGDLLSRVMAHTRSGNIWVTVQAHPNVVAVGVLIGLSGIIIAEGVSIDPMAVEKAVEEEIPLLVTQMTAYGVCAELARLGIAEPEGPRA